MMHNVASGASVASTSTKKKKKKKHREPPMDSDGMSAMTDDFSRISGVTSGTKKKKKKKKKKQESELEMASINGGAPSAGVATSGSSVGNNSKLAKALKHMNSSQSGEKEQIDFLKDPKEEMTYGRRIALALAGNRFYNVTENQWRMELLESSSDEEDSDDDSDDGSKGKKKKKKKKPAKDDGVLENDTMPTTPAASSAADDATSLDKSGGNRTLTKEESIAEIMSFVEERPPAVSRKEYPVLAKAWAYFEHSTLPRYIVEDEDEEDEYDDKGRRKKKSAAQELTRAEPGEDDDPTRLYSPLNTHISQMGDFGLGMGLYFWTLRGLSFLCLLAGIVSIPNILFYSSNSYSKSQAGVPYLLKGSAICTDVTFVPCVNCTASQFVKERFGVADAVNPFTNTSLTFALRNNCNGATLQVGMVNLGVLFLIIAAVQLMAHLQAKQEVEFDEDEQTAQDYSVHITNPPPDAFDPAEWREFFKKNFAGAHATAITVAIDNDLLIQALAERRMILKKLELIVDPGTKLDTLNLAYIAAEAEQSRSHFAALIANIIPGIPELFARVASLEAKIGGLAQLEYEVTNVFVSFEHERDQRAVLSGLSISDWEAMRQKVQPWSILFRDDVLLQAEEPDEPNTLIWENLNINRINLLRTLIITTTVALLSIYLIAVLINFLTNTESALVGAIAISVTNSVFPQAARLLNNFERHSSFGNKQTSLYFKINVFRWVNTAIVITIVTPFTRTLTNGGLLQSIYAIFFAEILTSNAIQLADIWGHTQRHVLAPRAKTQDLMNLNMKGTDFELAERYTNMTKVLFLCFWYNSIYPASFFMGFVALYITYYADRFSLMVSTMLR